ncbi:MAG: metallopeptidase TldD-related protein [Rudaea sp.]|uniref:metallopeptidase TldD-related protein n=1 Tax=Rudaea sp. TaxID=2136325 RepID=UPI0039E2F9DE
MKRSFLAFAVLFVCAGLARADAVQRAMSDEMQRSMRSLQLPGEARPYFIAYQVERVEMLDVQASLGAVGFSGERGWRYARVDVRVGDAHLDSSRMAGRAPIYVELPVEDDYEGIRRALWLATDAAYKRAVEDLAAKRGVLAAHDEPDRQSDQTPVPALHEVDAAAAPVRFDRAAAEAKLRELSRVFAECSDLEQSQVWLSQRVRHSWFANSEGTRVAKRVPEVQFGAAARARADDGLSVWDYDMLSASDLAALPAQADLAARLRALARRVGEQRRAVRLSDDYTGPVLFTGDAAGNLFGGYFAPQLWPAPRQYSNQAISAVGGSFERRIGSPVLPPGVSVDDDPLRMQFDGQALLSAFRVDDEGVAATKKPLIVNGRLKQLLCTRAPVGKHCSAGNSRGGIAAGSTLELASERPKTEAALRGELARAAHDAELPYALEVERLLSNDALQRLVAGSPPTWLGSGGQGEIVLRATLHYADGHSVPVRNVRLGNVDLRDFRTVVGVGDTPALYARSFGDKQITFLIPPLLFEELTASDDRSSTVKPPLLKSPLVK